MLYNYCIIYHIFPVINNIYFLLTLKKAVTGIIFWMVIALIAGFLFNCASYKKNPFAKSYHNMTAHYNAYFIAREELKEIENTIELNSPRNFNKILGIFPDIDSATIDPLRSKLLDIMKKASLVIQMHENSRWVDDSYYLIGKARFYGGQFVEAIETFKYVNTRSQDDDMRHKALVALMRTFIHYNEFNNAVAVADYLKKENMNQDNKLNFFLTSAYKYQLEEDYQNTILYLSEAVKLEKIKKHAAREYFVLGQLYQHVHNDSAAFASYKKCLKKSPDYELSFYAKLYMAEVTEPDLKADLKKIRKYFKKLLRDEKNVEYRDKIYYEMGKFELNHGNTDMAVQYLKLSLLEPLKHPAQKAYAYLILGKLYYDHYKNYELAQAYYDSTVNVLPPDDERFESVKKRQEILNEFVKQIRTIHLQDSLLTLSEMDPGKLSDLLDSVITAREKAKAEEQKRLERQRRQRASNFIAQDNNAVFTGQNNPFGQPGQMQDNSSSDTWYFYNPAVVSTGMSEFIKKWGNRPLEDNWRRSKKQAGVAFVNESAQAETDTLASASVEETSGLEAEKEQLMATIPLNDTSKTVARKKIEEAYFNLGNIYHFQLFEDDNAIETYSKLLQRFPDSEHEPEVLYTLFLIYKDRDVKMSEKYQKELINKYPKTLFAKLAVNPNYQKESDEASRRLKRMYEIAYQSYKEGNYAQARPLVARGIELYPDNPFTDKLRILGILIDGKLEGEAKYRYELQNFIKTFPESPMLDYAQKLLDAALNFKVKEAKRSGAKFSTFLDQSHFFVLVYQNNLNIADQLASAMDKYLDQNYKNKNLNTGNLTFDNGQSLLLINKFENKTDAVSFLTTFQRNKPLKDLLKDSEYKVFVITEDNFKILYKTKRLGDYLTFFNQYYKQ